MEFRTGAIIKKNSEKFLVSAMGDEIVMMNIETGDYVGLNPIGAAIWNLLDDPQSVEDLIQKLNERFDGGRDVIEKDVYEFLSNLKDHSIISIDQ